MITILQLELLVIIIRSSNLKLGDEYIFEAYFRVDMLLELICCILGA